MIRGVDASPAQGIVDWHAVRAAGIEFAYLEASIGNENPTSDEPTARFRENLAGARASGLVVGAYVFCYPLPDSPGHVARDPAAQMALAFRRCGGLGSSAGELPPALDMEWPAPQEWAKWGVTAADMRAWFVAACAEAKRLWGVAPILYTYPWWAKAADLGASPELAAVTSGLWIADYAKHTTSVPPDGATPTIPAPWGDWAIWQHTGGGLRMPSGVAGDFDVMRPETFAALQRR